MCGQAPVRGVFKNGLFLAGKGLKLSLPPTDSYGAEHGRINGHLEKKRQNCFFE